MSTEKKSEMESKDLVTMYQKMFCKICEKEVPSGGHIKYHNDEGKSKCPKCDKLFPTYIQGRFASK